MKTIIKLDDFLKEAQDKFGEDNRKWKFKCPRCKTAQCAEDFAVLDEFKDNKDRIGNFLGFSCIGRFTKEKGCDWTLGGLFKIHEIEVEDKEGKKHPHFQLAD